MVSSAVEKQYAGSITERLASTLILPPSPFLGAKLFRLAFSNWRSEINRMWVAYVHTRHSHTHTEIHRTDDTRAVGCFINFIDIYLVSTFRRFAAEEEIQTLPPVVAF